MSKNRKFRFLPDREFTSTHILISLDNTYIYVFQVVLLGSESLGTAATTFLLAPRDSTLMKQTSSAKTYHPICS